MVISEQDINNFTVEKARKRIQELSLKSIGEIPQLEEPNQEQKEWVIRKIKGRFV
jgi:hypothetical protein